MRILALALLLLPLNVSANADTIRYVGPIIDMHLHAYSDNQFWGPAPNPATGELSVASADEHRQRCVELMKKHQIVLAVVDSHSADVLDSWEEALGDGVIRGLIVEDPVRDLDFERFGEMLDSGRVELFGELAPSYAGYSPSDTVFEPYYEVCQRAGIPVAIHTGGSFPGIHRMYPRFRLRYGDPLQSEDILVKFPDMKVYLMHAGGHFYEHAAMMMMQYPGLYVDVAVINWLPDAGKFLVPFLRRAQEYEVLDRVMFGTDQMIWPEAIEIAIERIQSLNFLSIDEKKGIFYGNAARFLGLSDETIARHHEETGAIPAQVHD